MERMARRAEKAGRDMREVFNSRYWSLHSQGGWVQPTADALQENVKTS